MKINKLIFERKVKKKDFYTYLGISKQTLEDYLNEKTSMTVSTLKKVAEYFNVPVSYFFDDENKSQNNTGVGHIVSGFGSSAQGDITLSQFQQEVDMLKERIKDKEEIIILLKKQLKEKKVL
ncbi:MAG: helix-turn-helix transcriptional regulator [Prevotellaceae bacterium]|nr:helix-turn-helix transcriptional regulator [Prevotellaceae bacterium]